MDKKYFPAQRYTGLQEAKRSLFYQLAITCKTAQHNQYLICHAVSHILKRHYDKISRHRQQRYSYHACNRHISYIREAVY